MSDARGVRAEEADVMAVNARKRVILSMGGKGGVGKTSVMVGSGGMVRCEPDSGAAARSRHGKQGARIADTLFTVIACPS